jgi:predicted glycogen debranching enzyme
LELIRTFDVSTSPNPKQVLLEREWLLTNGLGGYSSGTLAGALTRRYHALLIAALGAPYGRTVLLNHIAEKVFTNESVGYNLDTEQTDEKNIIVHGEKHLKNFSLELGLPVWRFKINDVLLEKRILMPHLQNTIYINYSVVECNSQCTLNLRPSLQFRHYDLPLTKNKSKQYSLTAKQKKFEITTDTGYPFLRLYLSGEKTQFVLDGEKCIDTYHFVEADRGYESNGLLWTPGFIVSELKQGESITIIGSCESWDTICAVPFDDALSIEKRRRHRLIGSAVEEAQSGLAQELVIAADQFIITPIGRIADAARAHAEGDEVRSIIAGYHWFTDWGRDTMISLEGLTLVTGRHTEAGWILRTFAHYINNGLIPNLFPDGKNEGLYHTADATLWFFHALERYIYYTNDRKTLKLLLNKLINIIEHHITGTYFGIKADESDKLLVQGQNGYQLTWMDAKVSEWVVTPRKGKAVEINALWYNAIKLLAKWVTEERGISNAQYLNDLAETISISFNNRFWYAQGNYLYDVVDTQSGDDSSFRPNQIFSISLDNPVIKP